MSDLPPVTCPYAEPLAGPPSRGPSVVCRVMRADRERGRGLNLTAAGAGAERNSPDGVLVTERSDPSTLHGLCCGKGLPALGPEHSERRRAQHPTDCPVFQAERARTAAADMLGGESEAAPGFGAETYASPGFAINPEEW